MSDVQVGMLNTELWSELTKEQWLAKEYTIAKSAGVPLIVGLGYTAEQIAQLAPMVRPFADALELSCHYIGNDLTPIIDTVKAAKRAVDVPVFVKMSPHPNIQEIAVAVESAGADALVMINSFGPCMGIDIETGLPLMGSQSGYGWLSGRAIKALAVRCIFDASNAVKIPIFGVGGVATGKDVAEMFMAGASAVQLCTEAILKGPTVYAKIAAELNTFLDAHGYQSVNEIKGLTRRKIQQRPFSTQAVAPVVNKTRCISCGNCVKSCPYQAIQLIETKAVIDAQICFGCGLCISRCPVGAIRFGG
jgi:dihydroorotate dehydrogenase subfamily 1